MTALRAFEMRRTIARTAGTGMPDGWSRSVGSTSGSSEASGNIVVAMATVLHLFDRMTQSRNTEVARAERPLTARSIIASTLLGTHPPVLRGQLLVRLVELFGVAGGNDPGRASRAWWRPGS